MAGIGTGLRRCGREGMAATEVAAIRSLIRIDANVAAIPMPGFGNVAEE